MGRGFPKHGIDDDAILWSVSELLKECLTKVFDAVQKVRLYQHVMQDAG